MNVQKLAFLGLMGIGTVGFFGYFVGALPYVEINSRLYNSPQVKAYNSVQKELETVNSELAAMSEEDYSLDDVLQGEVAQSYSVALGKQSILSEEMNLWLRDPNVQQYEDSNLKGKPYAQLSLAFFGLAAVGGILAYASLRREEKNKKVTESAVEPGKEISSG